MCSRFDKVTEQVFNLGVSENSNKDLILSTTVELLAAEGLSVSLRKIARLAKVSPGLIVHHFGSRDLLVEAAIQSCLKKLIERKRSINSEGWNSGLIGLFLEISEPELNLLRRVLVENSDVASDLFESTMNHANAYLLKENPKLSRKELKLHSAVIAAQALGSVVMLPQLLKVVKVSELSNMNEGFSPKVKRPLEGSLN